MPATNPSLSIHPQSPATIPMLIGGQWRVASETYEVRDPYRGGVFIAFHGSWNRADRTGYKVIRVRMKDGAPTGEYEDFLTGFVVDEDHVWGRPVGVTVGEDGALYVSDDANGTVWRVIYSEM